MGQTWLNFIVYMCETLKTKEIFKKIIMHQDEP